MSIISRHGPDLVRDADYGTEIGTSSREPGKRLPVHGWRLRGIWAPTTSRQLLASVEVVGDRLRGEVERLV